MAGQSRSRPAEALLEGPPAPPFPSVCAACAAEALDPFARRYRYPFITCAACAPRAGGDAPACAACAAEWRDAGDRHHQAALLRCHTCGPRVRLERADGRATHFEQHSMLDDVDAVGSLCAKGEVVLVEQEERDGGAVLLCDATRPDRVAQLVENGAGGTTRLLLADRAPAVLAELSRLHLVALAAPLPSVLLTIALRRTSRPVLLTGAAECTAQASYALRYIPAGGA